MAQRVRNTKVGLMDGTGPLLQLTASLQPHAFDTPDGDIAPKATTLAIHMDRAAAIVLSEQIRDLARTMGWPLPPEGGHQG